MGHARGRVSALAFLPCHLGRIIPIDLSPPEICERYLWVETVGIGVLKNSGEIGVKAEQSNQSQEAHEASLFKF